MFDNVLSANVEHLFFKNPLLSFLAIYNYSYPLDLNRNKNENNASRKNKNKKCLKVRLMSALESSISGRKYDGNHTKTCPHCFKIEKKNKLLKSGNYSVYIMKSVFS